MNTDGNVVWARVGDSAQWWPAQVRDGGGWTRAVRQRGGDACCLTIHTLLGAHADGICACWSAMRMMAAVRLCIWGPMGAWQ